MKKMPLFVAWLFLSNITLFTATAGAAELDDAVSAYEAEDYAAALPLFEALAANNDDDAMWYLGKMYDKGWGVAQSDEQAYNWYLRSAKLGDPDAQWDVGIMHDIGQFVKVDQKDAFEWYLKAAENNHIKAMPGAWPFWVSFMKQVMV